MGLWSGCSYLFDRIFREHDKRLNGFRGNNRWQGKMRCRIGAYHPPKAKMTKHRKFIKKMSARNACA